MLSSQDIREKFTNYFEKNGHEKIESSPLIPQNDPTLLFANAGMNQFKDYFTGKANAKNKRAVTIQKCVRAGGKHNDLENVGLTARHHTYFEMLGNFSFGDYFKKEAIKFAWDFLTNDLKIPKDKLYVTVHTSDEEAAKIWNEQEGVPKDRIFYLGDKDNFWEMGEIGPCGPCSEIFYDHGQQYSDGADTSECLLADEGRYVEIWNLVFMQYEKFKDADGKVQRKELPKPSVDTGAGLERLTACMQNVYWNYDIDTFAPILKKLEELSGKKYSDKKYQTNMRVVCDHIRSSVMLITDGVIPSNEGRGYVLRRIIRRAIRHLSELGINDISFYKLIGDVFEKLGHEYPQNKSNSALAEKLLKIEEEKFRKTLKTGLELLTKEMNNLAKNSALPGEIAFKLYDTYGFPLDLTQTILQEKDFTVDTVGYEAAMKKQKESSKASANFAVKEDNLKAYYDIKEKFGASEFNGYENISGQSKLLAVVEEENFTALIFDQTPFYPEGGGQTGDHGSILVNGNVVADVVDTQKPVEDLIVHYCKVTDQSAIKTNNEYQLQVDSQKRELTKRNHSATHLLQSALIEVLGDHVKQAGSRVSHDSLRFDFTHPEAMKKDEVEKVEELVNAKIGESLEVNAKLMDKKEATAKGAMALFGEKYGDIVRTLEMGDFSFELCGGTHVDNTKEIGIFSVLLETSLSSGVRRIEALTSNNAFKHLNERSKILANLERAFSTSSSEVLNRVESLQDEVKKKNKEIQKLKDQMQSQNAKDLFANAKDIGKSFKFILANLENGNPKEFRSLSDKFIDSNKEDVLLLYSVDGEKVSYLLRTEKKNKSINCSQIIKTAQAEINGRGGGKPDMAQGSGDAKNMQVFINKIEENLKEL